MKLIEQQRPLLNCKTAIVSHFISYNLASSNFAHLFGNYKQLFSVFSIGEMKFNSRGQHQSVTVNHEPTPSCLCLYVKLPLPNTNRGRNMN